MISKVDIRPIVRSHLRTLRLPRNGRLLKRDVIGFYVAPAAIGGVLAFCGVRFDAAFIDYGLVAHTIYIPLLVSVLFSIFSISQSSRFSAANLAQGDNAAVHVRKLRKLLSEVCDNIAYVIVMSFLSAAMLSAARLCTMFNLDMPYAGDDTDAFLNSMINAAVLFVAYSLVLHIILTTLMIVKRAHAVLALEFEDDN